MTLIVFHGGTGLPSLYLVPREIAEPYFPCHGCILNHNDESDACAGGVADKTEHLAYMLGESEFYDEGGIPSLSDFLSRIKAERETANPEPVTILRHPACDPPWKQFRIPDNPEVDFSRVTRLISCGWLP